MRDRPQFEFAQVNWDSPQAQGLKGWWPLQGLPARDALTVTPLSTRAGAPALAASPYGLAYSFNGSSLVYGTNTIVPAAFFPCTFAAWVMALAAGDRFFGFGSTASSQPIISLGESANKFQCFYRDDATFSATATASAARTLGVWYHVAGVISSAADCALYVNGVPVATGNNSAQMSGNTTCDRIAIGGLQRASSGNYWNGQVCHAAVWGRVLPATELYALYDPATRWDLYWRRRKSFFFVPNGGGGSPPATNRRRRMLLLGAA